MRKFFFAAVLSGLFLAGCDQEEKKMADVDIRPKVVPDFIHEGVRADIEAGIGLKAYLTTELRRQATVHRGSPLEHRSCRAKHELSGWDVFCTSVGMYGAYYRDNSTHDVYGGAEVRNSMNRRRALSTNDAAEFILGS